MGMTEVVDMHGQTEGMLAKSTLVYLLNSIVYPSNPKLTICVLFKSQVFIIYAETCQAAKRFEGTSHPSAL